MKKQNKPHFWEGFLRKLLPFDHLVLLYCWIIVILMINFVRPLNEYLEPLFFHIGMIFLTILIALFIKPNKNRIFAFVRYLYPLLALTFFYHNCGKLVGVIITRFYDQQIIALEKSIIGLSLTVWLDGHLHVFWNELMSLGYFSYYFMIPGLALFLFFHKRDNENIQFVTATCVTFFISYLVFLFYPVAGPRFYFEGIYQNEITGPFFRQLVNQVINNAAFRGGAMPSSHVAEAVVTMIFAIRSYGKKAWFLVPAVACLALGTIYGRFHYLTDVVLGLLLGFIISWLTIQFNRLDKEPAKEVKLTDEEILKRYVSNHH